MKQDKQIKKSYQPSTPLTSGPSIRIPGETVHIGPGTVPTSAVSSSTTQFDKLEKGFKEASKQGTFGTVQEEYQPDGAK